MNSFEKIPPPKKRYMLIEYPAEFENDTRFFPALEKLKQSDSFLIFQDSSFDTVIDKAASYFRKHQSLKN